MKFELIPNGKYEMYGTAIFDLYITRTEFIKKYEEDKTLCHDAMLNIIDMFTMPNCFEYSVKDDFIEPIYNNFINHKSYKGLLLSIENRNEDDITLKFNFLSRYK